MFKIKDHVLLPVLARTDHNSFIRIAKKMYEKMGIGVPNRSYDGVLEWVKFPERWNIIEVNDLTDLLYDDNNNLRGEITYEVNKEGYLTYAIFKEVK